MSKSIIANSIFFNSLQLRVKIRTLSTVICEILINIQRQFPVGISKKDVLKNFSKCTGKRLCWSLFFIKLQDAGMQLYLKRDFQRMCNFIQKDTPTKAFFRKFWKIF